MTQLLLRLFVKNHRATGDPKVRSAIGKFSGLVGIVCNLLLFGLKLTAGLLASSVSVVTDAMNNLSDATSSIVTLIGFRLAEQPADKEHPYGHARFEYLSGLAVAAIIIVIGFEMARTAFEKIIHPEVAQISVLTVVILVVSVLLKLWLSIFNRGLGKMIGSGALQAAAVDSRNDVIATSAVLLAAIVEKFAGISLDGVMGLCVALFILYSGAALAKETVSPLLGEAASPELRGLIVDYLENNPKVLGYHDLMVHDYGPGQRFASLHVEMDAREDPLYCHELIDDMERECLTNHGIHLVIHYDPVVTDDPELTRLHTVVDGILHDLDPRLSTHDFRMVAGSGHTNLIFDVCVPTDMHKNTNEIKAYLDEKLMQNERGSYYTVVTFDTSMN